MSTLQGNNSHFADKEMVALAFPSSENQHLKSNPTKFVGLQNPCLVTLAAATPPHLDRAGTSDKFVD